MKLVEEIKKSMELEIRQSPEDVDFNFEAVFESKDLDKLLAILRDNIGEPLKPPRKQAKVSRDAKEVIDLMGGIRYEQSFYLRQEATGEYLCVALWPWQSDSSRITLKVRRGRFAPK